MIRFIVLLACLLGTVLEAWPPAPAPISKVIVGKEAYEWVTPATLAGRTTVIDTNWISGQLYTNNYGVPILVTANFTVNVYGNASGSALASIYVFTSPLNGGTTNVYAFYRQNPMYVSMNYQGSLQAFVPTNAVFCFTNNVTVYDGVQWWNGQLIYP